MPLSIVRKTRLIFLALIVSLTLPACSFDSSDSITATSSSNIIFTAAAQTVEAELTLIASGVTITPSPVNTAPAGTSLPVAGSATPTTQSEGPTPTPGEAGCNKGSFVQDVSIPDETQFGPGETFEKTWRIENAGTCTWTSGYSVVFEEGDAMGGPASFQLTNTPVEPGQEVDISVSLTAPSQPGRYRGDWKLRAPSGEVFGLGSEGTASFWVIIQVGETPSFTINYDNIHDCDGIPHATFQLSNQGEIALESGEISLYNTTDDRTIFGPLAHNGPFMGGPDECPQGGDTFETGSTAYMGASLGAQPPSGHRMRVTIKLCTDDAMDGACAEESLTFTVP